MKTAGNKLKLLFNMCRSIQAQLNSENLQHIEDKLNGKLLQSKSTDMEKAVNKLILIMNHDLGGT